MKYNIVYSPQSLGDLDEIWEYISCDLCNPQSAENTINGILYAIDRLKDFPEAGAPLSSMTDMESDYRFLISGNCLTFYRLVGSQVYIDRVLYSRRNYIRILFPDSPDNNTDE